MPRHVHCAMLWRSTLHFPRTYANRIHEKAFHGGRVLPHGRGRHSLQRNPYRAHQRRGHRDESDGSAACCGGQPGQRSACPHVWRQSAAAASASAAAGPIQRTAAGYHVPAAAAGLLRVTPSGPRGCLAGLRDFGQLARLRS